MKFLIKVFSIFCLLLLILSTTIIWWFNYEELIIVIKNTFSKTYEIDQIQNYFKEENLKKTRIFFSILLAFALIILFIKPGIRRISNLIYNFLVVLKNKFLQTADFYFRLSIYEKITLIIVFPSIIIHKIIFLKEFPFESDEVFSYIFFVKENFLTATFYYPEPNNHILYNLTCYPFSLIVRDPVLAMRIPSLLILILTIFLSFPFLTRISNFKVAVASIIFSSFSFPISLYSIQGRGYMLLAFFTIISSIALFNFLSKNENKNLYLAVFIFSSSLGAYTIPVFFLPFCGLVIYGILNSFKNKSGLKKIILATVATGLITLLFYSPVILFNGSDALFNNKWVISKSITYYWRILKPALLESFNFCFSLNKYGYIAVTVLGILILLFYKKNRDKEKKQFITMIVTMLTITFLTMSILRVFPPYRTWVIFMLPAGILFSVCLYEIIFLKGILKDILFFFCVLTITIHFIYNFKPDPDKKEFYNSLSSHVDYILKQKPHNIYIYNHDHWEYYLTLKAGKNHLAIDVANMRKNMDYDFLIVSKAQGFNPGNNFKKTIEFDNTIVWKKNL